MMTIPLLLRCIFDMLQEIPAWISLFKTTADLTTYNIFFFLFTTYSLIVAQCATLIFGILRTKQMNEYKTTKQVIKKEI